MSGTKTIPQVSPARLKLFSAVTGLVALAVLLQGVWAGIFLEHDGRRDASKSWIDVHARGAEVSLILAVVAVVIAASWLRPRRDLLIGSIVLVVLLFVESYLGGAIHDDGKDTLTAVHVPLGMAIMAASVWLPMRAARRG